MSKEDLRIPLFPNTLLVLSRAVCGPREANHVQEYTGCKVLLVDHPYEDVRAIYLDRDETAILFAKLDALEDAAQAVCPWCSQGGGELMWSKVDRAPMHTKNYLTDDHWQTSCQAFAVRRVQMRLAGWL